MTIDRKTTKRRLGQTGNPKSCPPSQSEITRLRASLATNAPDILAGLVDVLGQFNDGRLLGVKVNAQAGRLRLDQTVFLKRIRCTGGVALVARDLRDVPQQLNIKKDPTT